MRQTCFLILHLEFFPRSRKGMTVIQPGNGLASHSKLLGDTHVKVAGDACRETELL